MLIKLCFQEYENKRQTVDYGYSFFKIIRIFLPKNFVLLNIRNIPFSSSVTLKAIKSIIHIIETQVFVKLLYSKITKMCNIVENEAAGHAHAKCTT